MILLPKKKLALLPRPSTPIQILNLVIVHHQEDQDGPNLMSALINHHPEHSRLPPRPLLQYIPNLPDNSHIQLALNRYHHLTPRVDTERSTNPDGWTG